MIVWGRFDTRPLPERPNSHTEATERGWDPDSVIHDRAWAGTPRDSELLDVAREQAAEVRRVRDEDYTWRWGSA